MLNLGHPFYSERSRIQKTSILTGATPNAGTTVVTYVGGHYEKITQPDGSIEEKFYIYGPNGLAAIKTKVSGSAKIAYPLHDNLGSVHLLVDEAGSIVEAGTFSAFGERRNNTGWENGADPTFQSTTPRRGFTGHEQLDAIGLVHMNGRVYDPQLGRFMSADPFVSDAHNLQAYNSYSYVLNNPLSYTDPTGFISSSQFGMVLASAAIGTMTWGAGSALTGAWGLTAVQAHAVAGAIGGAVNSSVMGGNRKQVGIAAVTGALFGMVAGAEGFDSLGKAMAAGSIGTLGGAMAGTDPMQGFAASFVGAGMGAPMPSDRVLSALIAITLAGTASEIGGGKFANGALSGAFHIMMSVAASAKSKGQSDAPLDWSANPSTEDVSAEIERARSLEFFTGEAYTTQAALQFIPIIVRGIRIGWQVGSRFVTKGVGNFSRKLDPSDLGVKGNLKELRGTFSVQDGVATARVDMIKGKIDNPLQIVNNLANTARTSGANSLRIEGTLANEKLYNVLSRRYGLTSNGATDVITIPLK